MSTDTERPVTAVLGATGHIGCGVVTALLRAGHHVIAVGHHPARSSGSAERPDPETPGWCTQVGGDLDEEASAAAVLQSMWAATDRIDNVVAALPGWYWGRRVVDTSVDELQDLLGRWVRLHVVAARTFLPLLPGPTGRYVLITSPAATTPLPELGAMSIAAAAELMLGRALAVEQPPDGPCVTVLQVTAPVLARDDPRADPSMPTAEEVGEEVSRLLTRPPRPDPGVRWPFPEARPYRTAEDLVAALPWGAQARDEQHAWAGQRPAGEAR